MQVRNCEERSDELGMRLFRELLRGAERRDYEALQIQRGVSPNELVRMTRSIRRVAPRLASLAAPRWECVISVRYLAA